MFEMDIVMIFYIYVVMFTTMNIVGIAVLIIFMLERSNTTLILLRHLIFRILRIQLGMRKIMRIQNGVRKIMRI
jgi:hypothetical protein